MGWDWIHFVWRPLFGLLYQSRMIDDECEAIGEMIIGRGNRSTRRKPTPVPLCPLQIPPDLTWPRTRVAAVGSRRLTPWARPCSLELFYLLIWLIRDDFWNGSSFITLSIVVDNNFQAQYRHEEFYLLGRKAVQSDQSQSEVSKE
jgi:hypothetical protein